jgi:hypothetical protein
MSRSALLKGVFQASDFPVPILGAEGDLTKYTRRSVGTREKFHSFTRLLVRSDLPYSLSGSKEAEKPEKR